MTGEDLALGREAAPLYAYTAFSSIVQPSMPLSGIALCFPNVRRREWVAFCAERSDNVLRNLLTTHPVFFGFSVRSTPAPAFFFEKNKGPMAQVTPTWTAQAVIFLAVRQAATSALLTVGSLQQGLY
ncbi:hypothetical protein [Novosphingobium sediminicola]|uniref:Uncharacterized protein n=1 Tax=Novosphingobium sediminicola TaxID=563162 RepID=A0A7W6CJ63_9SPHN|nr:hypothetical protein [Novosphingobium sediminicola]MBB3956852.1 hypothetical protein [Novosphingobium sediminicola]